MILIIAGSRSFNDYNLLSDTINHYLSKTNKKDVTIISGGAKGADTIAKQYAKTNNYKFIEHLANWNKHGKSAGFHRNYLMAQKGTHLIAFHNGTSPGTLNMIKLAKNNNLKVIVVNYGPPQPPQGSLF